MRSLRGLVAGLPEESSGELSCDASCDASSESPGEMPGELSEFQFWPRAFQLHWQQLHWQPLHWQHLHRQLSWTGLLRGLTGLILVASGSAALAEIEIREVPLRWQQAAISDGGQLYLELCAACHGKSGNGDGPAAAALKKPTPDLTVLAANNNGVFPREVVEDAITGKTSTLSHGTLDMPISGAAFEGVRPDWKPFRREALARQRIHNLTEYISDIQTR